MKQILCFGEVLWDLLPSGKVLGGAPFNVAFRLNELKDEVLFCSAVGKDAYGQEIIEKLQGNRIPHFLNSSDQFQTGLVNVNIQTDGSATYTIENPAAWDDIKIPENWSGELVFGSLALRNEHNQGQVLRLLEMCSKSYFDVNLRAPYYSFEQINFWISKADLIKFNEEEFQWFGKQLNWSGNQQKAIANFMKSFPKKQLCITLGEKGALLVLGDNDIYSAKAPKVKVADTIGAGDAFFASLIHELRMNTSPQGALEKACEVGAKVATQIGATLPLHT